MSAPRFSIVIPTRDREDTLGATLQTCLGQEFESFEIVLADNSTTNATHALVQEIGSPRIKYVRTPRPLAMSDNWDFAVEQASGEFVTLIGSDDGLLPHALPELDKLLRMLGSKILRWDAACYNWPSLPAQEFLAANDLLIPMKQTDWYLPIDCRDSRQMIQAAANSEIPYSDLPMIYCSAVHRDLIDQLRRKIGRVFRGECPDVFSGFALAYLAGSYHSIAAPLSISALSRGSNGLATIFLKDASPISDDFYSLNREAGLLPHPQVPHLPVLPALAADSFLNARESLFPEDTALSLDRRKMIENSLKEWRPADEATWQRALSAVRHSLLDDPALREWFEAGPAQTRREDFEFAPVQKLRRYGQNYLHLDAAAFGVTNVVEAAQLCEKLLGFKRDGMNAHLRQSPIPARVEPTSEKQESSPDGVEQASVYQQEAEIAIILVLAGRVKHQTFVDVGAEKGSFSKRLLEQGFRGCLFEPFPAHLPRLQTLVEGTSSRVLPFAIDEHDHDGLLHVAVDAEGKPMDYFHSLHHDDANPNAHHAGSFPVICRSLDSLTKEGVIDAITGIVKVDTEGNDLRVLLGMGQAEAEVLMCEFVTPSLYPTWTSSFPEALEKAARERGYDQCIAVRRFGNHEIITLNPSGYADGQWGNLIFLHSALLDLALEELRPLLKRSEEQLVALALEDQRSLEAKEKVIQELVGSSDKRELEAKEAVIQELAQACRERLALIENLAAQLQHSEERERMLREEWAASTGTKNP